MSSPSHPGTRMIFGFRAFSHRSKISRTVTSPFRRCNLDHIISDVCVISALGGTYFILPTATSMLAVVSFGTTIFRSFLAASFLATSCCCWVSSATRLLKMSKARGLDFTGCGVGDVSLAVFVVVVDVVPAGAELFVVPVDGARLSPLSWEICEEQQPRFRILSQ